MPIAKDVFVIRFLKTDPRMVNSVFSFSTSKIGKSLLGRVEIEYLPEPDSIKSFSGQRVEVSKGKTENKSPEKVESVISNVSGKKVDAVLTSKSKEALKVMAENPSVDMEAVEKLKEKIRNGEYPIDFDKLADRLLESYWISRS